MQITVKYEATFEGVKNLLQAVKLFGRSTQRKEWDPQWSELKQLELDEEKSSELYRVVIKAPIPFVWDRDNIMRTYIVKDGDKKIWFLARTADHPDYPVIDVKDNSTKDKKIRVVAYISSCFEMIGETTMKYTSYIKNPRAGEMPSIGQGMMAKSIPKKILESYRKALTKVQWE